VTVTEALKILQRADGPAYPAFLVCGFTPLHLKTFLAAHLQQRLPDRKVSITTGLFGNVAVTLESLTEASMEQVVGQAVVIALEWQDLDPRLGFRSAGAWGPSILTDVVAEVRATLDRIASAIGNVPVPVAVACSLPTLPLPPMFPTPGWQTAEAELALERELLEFAERLSHRRGFSIVNRQRLAEESPAAARFDLKSDLLTGLPYTVPHADRVAAVLARLIAPPAAKKGLITDLDDTLWHGLVGEIGPENVSWDLAGHHHLHGLYQKLLASFSEEGVLIGIASRNDPAPARRALERPDMLLPADRVFPVEIHWSAKSGSVERILRVWNIDAESVVFVDDSPMELAEVAAVHPGIECVPFPAGDASAGFALLRRLRDLFGKPRLAEEDAIRLDSIRQRASFRQVSQNGSSAETFLEQADAVIALDFDLLSSDPRILELVNKTNQFNLNGIRYTEAEWSGRRARAGAVLMTASYRDKFGPLGKIAVIEGWREGDALHIGTWVMSCRAFARRIEHQCLKALFDHSGAAKMLFDFVPTAKNGPLREFLTSLTGTSPEGPVELTRQQFAGMCPPLYHHVEKTQSTISPWTTSQPA
jgi:FkbH-like protein